LVRSGVGTLTKAARDRFPLEGLCVDGAKVVKFWHDQTFLLKGTGVVAYLPWELRLLGCTTENDFTNDACFKPCKEPDAPKPTLAPVPETFELFGAVSTPEGNGILTDVGIASVHVWLEKTVDEPFHAGRYFERSAVRKIDPRELREGLRRSTGTHLQAREGDFKILGFWHKQVIALRPGNWLTAFDLNELRYVFHCLVTGDKVDESCFKPDIPASSSSQRSATNPGTKSSCSTWSGRP
jgi:hypothetical protein